jgi:hypothetical protein
MPRKQLLSHGNHFRSPGGLTLEPDRKQAELIVRKARALISDWILRPLGGQSVSSNINLFELSLIGE